MGRQLGQPWVLVYHQVDGEYNLVFHYPFDPFHRVALPYNDIAVCEHAFTIFTTGDDHDFVTDPEDLQLFANYASEAGRKLETGDVLCLRNFGGVNRYYRRRVADWVRVPKANLNISNRG